MRMRSSLLRADEIAPRSRKVVRATSSVGEAGALRSLVRDRGLQGTLQGPTLVLPDRIGMIVALAFAFLSIAIGTFFLIISVPYLWQVLKLIGKKLS